MTLITTVRRRLLRRSLISAAALGSAAALAVGASAGTGVAGAASTTSKAPYTINFGFISATSGVMTGPWGFAYSKGLLQKWLKSDGIALKVAHFANGPLLTAAMIGGSIDLGILGDTPALIARGQGLQARFLAQPELGLSAWLIAQPSIHTLSQLVGKTVAVQQGSYLDRYVQGLLSENGLLSKVNRVAMLSAQSTPAFEAGSIDAILAQPSQWPTFQKTGKGYNIIAKSETTPALEGTQAEIATNKILAAHPDLPQQFNAARVKAVNYANAHASAYYAWAAKNDQSNSAAEKIAGPLSNYPVEDFTATGIKHLQSTLNFLVSQKEAKAFNIKQWELQS